MSADRKLDDVVASLSPADASTLAAIMARLGLHSLAPYWTPDDGDVDPLDADETRADVRSFVGQLFSAAMKARRGTRYQYIPAPSEQGEGKP